VELQVLKVIQVLKVKQVLKELKVPIQEHKVL